MHACKCTEDLNNKVKSRGGGDEKNVPTQILLAEFLESKRHRQRGAGKLTQQGHVYLNDFWPKH